MADDQDIPETERFFFNTLKEAIQTDGWRRIIAGLPEPQIAALEAIIDSCGYGFARTAEEAVSNLRVLRERRVIIFIEPPIE